jgi:alpha/beta superfamily hydrolase
MTFVGVTGTGRVIAESGQSMSSSTSSTAARAFVRRSHLCVRLGFSVSYGRFLRGTGEEVAAAARLVRWTHLSCALPPPCGLLGSP